METERQVNNSASEPRSCILLCGLVPANLKDFTGLKVRGALQQRMKQQHEREWGNTHASLSAAAVAAAAAVWGWASYF